MKVVHQLNEYRKHLLVDGSKRFSDAPWTRMDRGVMHRALPFLLALSLGVVVIYTYLHFIQNYETVRSRNLIVNAPPCAPIPDANPFNEFKSRQIPDWYSVEMRSETSMLWPHGCPGERSNPREQCTSPRDSILFVKTHKCGGSTLSSSILRRAYERKLPVALPKFDSGHIGWPSPYRPFFKFGYRKNQFIAAHHLIYDRCFVQNDFPPEQVVYISILRKPWDMFVSSVSYFPIPHLRETDTTPLRTILDNPDKYAEEVPILMNYVMLGTTSFLRNPMSRDLGFPLSQAKNKSSVDLFIKRLDHDFDLIMILEYYHESLIMLKRLMCWQLKDIIYLHLNHGDSAITNRHQFYKNVKQETVTTSMKEAYRDFSNVDHELYDFFLQKFEQNKKAQGENFYDEVKTFKEINAKIQKFCSDRNSNITQITIPLQEFTPEFNVTRKDCSRLSLMPDDYTLALWTRASQQYTQFWTPKFGRGKWPYQPDGRMTDITQKAGIP